MLVSGLRSGIRATLRSGLNPSDVGGDGPSGVIQVPMTAAGFAALTGRTPVHAYTCQEASGNLIDQVGALTLAAAGTPLYQQAVAGWTRKGVGFNELVGQRFTVAAGSGPNPTSTAVAMLAYMTFRTVGAMRGCLLIADAGAGARVAVGNGTTGILRTQCVATNNDGTVDHRDTLVHPVLLTVDVANTSVNRYTDDEKDNGTYAVGVLDGTKGIGSFTAQNSHMGECLALWIFSGADAQFTDAEAKTMLGNLGWAGIPWS